MKNIKQNSIKIEVYGGCVTEVTGLPEGWDYEIVDHDHLEELQATSVKQQATSSPQSGDIVLTTEGKK
jgi:hypothetical protein